MSRPLKVSFQDSRYPLFGFEAKISTTGGGNSHMVALKLVIGPQMNGDSEPHDAGAHGKSEWDSEIL
jgi:hypothetical protein